MRRQTEFPDTELSDDEPRPLDPALIAARILIEHALSAVGATMEDVGRDGAVCTVMVPAVAWAEAVRDAWKAFARGDDPYSENTGRFWTRDRWIAVAPGMPTANRSVSEISIDRDETFADAIWRGLHCAGFAVDLEWLPPDLVQAADYRLVLPPLSGADLRALASELCASHRKPKVCGTDSLREPTTSISDNEAAALTPRLIRLARRQDQSTDAYLLKLRDLLGREQATAIPAPCLVFKTPRDAPTLDRLHGLDEAVAWGRMLAQDIAAYEAGTLPWSAVDRGCMLSGPPGVGKTLFARALAATCGVALISGSYSEWLGSGAAHQGDLLKSMRKAFADARAQAPAILFIDEIDSFPDRARVTHRYREWDTQVVNALLAEIDGVQGREGVVVIAACNHPDKLDPALTRSGRLDRHVRIGLPDRPALARIFREHLGDDLAGEDLAGVALLAAGSSGADCERYVRGARRRARSKNRLVALADLLAEVGGDDDPNLIELGLAAVHEAGHAVASCVLCPGSLGVVSVQTSGSARHGGSSALRALPTYPLASDFRDRLVILLAGRAAEEIVLGEPSAGAGGGSDSDLAKATLLATSTVSACGFGDGLLWSGVPDDASLSRTLAMDPALVRCVQETLADTYASALDLVRGRQGAVEAVAGALVARRALDGAEVGRIVASNP